MTPVSHTTAVTLPLAGGFRFGDWTVVPNENLIRKGDQKIRLEPKVMRLLLALVARHDQVCTRDELLDELWPSPETTETSLTRALSELRRALGDSRDKGRYIETIQRVGYKASAPLAPLAPKKSGPPTDQLGQPLDSAEEVVTLADYLVARRNAKDFAHAIELLGDFASHDPNHAQVFAMLAYAERIIPLYREEPVGLRIAQARAHALQALRLDGANGLAWSVLGGLAHDQWQWREALKQFERAVSFSPFDANVLHDYSELLLHLGDLDLALECIERACRIKPVSAAERLVLAWVLLHTDEPRARQELVIARRLGVDSVFADNLECLLNHRSGWNETTLNRWKDLNEARGEDPLWMWPDYFIEAAVNGSSYGVLGHEVRRRVESGDLDAGVGLFFLASAGSLSEAFVLADRAVAERRLFIVDPWLEETRRFREEQAFGELRGQIGLDKSLMRAAG